MTSVELIISLLGLSLGSFINSCAYRIPRGVSVVKLRSFCPACNVTLKWYEIIPVAGFLINRGRCRSCSSRIPLVYPLAELMIAGLTLFFFLRHGFASEFLVSTLFMLLMALIAIIDWQHLLIPNKIILFGFLLALPLKILPLDFAAAAESLLVSAIAGAVSLSILLFGNWIFKSETMGLGDVKLSALVGFYLGLQGFLVSFWLAALTGAIFGLVRIALSKGAADRRIPFGSFLAACSVAYLLLQDRFQEWIDLWLTSILW